MTVNGGRVREKAIRRTVDTKRCSLQQRNKRNNENKLCHFDRCIRGMGNESRSETSQGFINEVKRVLDGQARQLALEPLSYTNTGAKSGFQSAPWGNRYNKNCAGYMGSVSTVKWHIPHCEQPGIWKACFRSIGVPQ